jgi:hypothetical protein
MWQIILLLLIFSQGIHLLLSPSKQKELAEKRDLRRRTGCQSWNQQNSMRIWTEKNESRSVFFNRNPVLVIGFVRDVLEFQYFQKNLSPRGSSNFGQAI